jgi:alkylhydroperoxidase/carboxymuconolactone decarboxylase family protein YurZ
MVERLHQEIYEVNQNHKENTLVFLDENLRHGFTQIPNVVLRNPELTSTSKCLYALLLSYAWQTQSCFPGHDTLACELGCTRQTIINSLNELREYKLINWKRRGLGKVNIYYIERLAGQYIPRPFVDKPCR